MQELHFTDIVFWKDRSKFSLRKDDRWTLDLGGISIMEKKPEYTTLFPLKGIEAYRITNLNYSEQDKMF